MNADPIKSNPLLEQMHRQAFEKDGFYITPFETINLPAESMNLLYNNPAITEKEMLAVQSALDKLSSALFQIGGNTNEFFEL